MIQRRSRWILALIGLSCMVGAPLSGGALSPQILDKFRDDLQQRIESGQLNKSQATPTLIATMNMAVDGVSSIEAMNQITGVMTDALNGRVVFCDECQLPRVEKTDQGVSILSGTPSLEALRTFDRQRRQNAKGEPAARSALFATETSGGFSYRLVDLQTGRVLVASTISANSGSDYSARSLRHFGLRKEYNRRGRGDGILHGFYDLGVYPSAHLGASWLEQWGEGNRYLTGFSMTIVDPVLGAGLAFFRVMPELGNALIGGKVLVSLPTALASASEDNEATDASLVTAVGMIRYPLSKTYNTGLIVFVSTNGNFGIGLSF